MQKIKYLVIRKPVLLEDEGRQFMIGQHDSRADAQQWIDQQVGKYHPPGDYIIVED